MAKQYIHEIGDKLSVGSTADNLPKHIKEIAPVMYNDGSNNFNSIQTALNGKAASTHSHGNIASGGTLTDTAAAAAGNDYVVIRDADNSKVQTSTIKGTDVADAVSKKHSHSTLTLSTTAQAYDGSHTLALPSTDPYTSARTPSSHASSATTYGVGTTANYGHVKLATGDMNGATHDDGVAVSKNHTHSQYLPKSGGAMTGAITRDLGNGVISDTNLLTVSGSTDGFKVDYGATTSDAGVTKMYTTDDANAKISIGNYNSSYKEAIGITNGSAALSNTPTAPTAAAGTNSTQIATTAFVNTAITAGQYIIPDAYCSTAAGTAAKTATCAGFNLTDHVNVPFRIYFTAANTSAGALTLSLNSQTAKPIYINGTASSASNYTIPIGVYWCVYDRTEFLLWTDKRFTGRTQGDGRNLLSAFKYNASRFTETNPSDDINGASYTHIKTSGDSYIQIKATEPITTGDMLTLSFDVSGLNTSGNEYAAFCAYALNKVITHTINKNGRCVYYFTKTETADITTGSVVNILDDISNIYTTAPSGFTISNIKLERGFVADPKYTRHPSESRVSKAEKIATSAKIGDTNKPVYIAADGTVTAGSTYAAGTAVTLNGTSKSASTASFYAPTGTGTSGQLLKSSGSGAPTWATANAALVGITVTSSSVSDGTNTFNKYTHPTYTAQSAKGSATKVPQITTDSTGHVTGITEVTITGVTPASHTHGNISNTGTLTDTAAAAAGNDYVVIRDADNAKVQTSTIKGTDVADSVSKKHSHSTLTLSTTAQAYDGSHTLALPARHPYTSARTPSSHTHGNIQNGGTLQSSDVAIANGDKLVVTDSSDSSKIARSSVSFDGSTTTTALTPKGTFEAFAKAADIVTTMGAYCDTAAATAAKVATSTNTVLTSGMSFLIRIVNANTYAGKLTLNINSQGARDVWINGAVSSSSNYTIPAGEHWCHYDGSVFHIWTDGTAQFKNVAAKSYKGLEYTDSENLAYQIFRGGSYNTSISSDATSLTISPVDTDTYFSVKFAEAVSATDVLSVSMDVEYTGSDDGAWYWPFGIVGQSGGIIMIFTGSGHYAFTGTAGSSVNADEYATIDDNGRVAGRLPANSFTIKNIKIERGTTPTGFRLCKKEQTATKATQDSDGNAINATYFKSSGNVTLVSNTATKIGTQNGADVKLTLPAIPAAVSVKGNAESSYRTGQVNLTPANLGISATTSSVTVGSTTFNKYTHPTTSGNKHVPSGGSSGQFLGWDSDGTAKWVANPNTDTKVTQTKDDSGTTAYPLLMAGATNPNGTATTSRYDSGVTLTPSTNTISANISGNAATSDKSTVSQKYDPAYTGENSIKDALDTKLAMTDLDQNLSQINLSSTYLASDQRLVLNNMIFGSTIYPIVGNYGLAIFRDDPIFTLNPDATEISGDQDWLLDWRPYLIDMTPVQGETAKTPVKELNRANWLRDVDGNYAPVCCVKPAQKNSLNGESIARNLVWGNASRHSTKPVGATQGCNAYLNDGSYTFNAEGFWEYVKNHWADINNLARTGYSSGIDVEVYDGTHTYRYGGYSADGTDHIPAPWETTNTNLSVFIGRTKDCYVIDGYSETTGEYLRGLTAKPVEVGSKKFDPENFRLKRTGISPGPSTTVNNCIRNFFYNYAGVDSDTNGNNGTASTGIFYNNGTYPRVNVSQYATNVYSRNCNYDGSSRKAVPVGEGGFHALNAFLCSIEAAYGTRDLWNSTSFSPGVSSNNTASVDNGGCQINGNYYTWSSSAVTIQGSSSNLSDQVNGYYPKFQCMEPQIAASLAVEMGIAEGQYFQWNGGSWRYMKPSITGIKSLDHATDKRMNCRIYKITNAKTVNSKVVKCHLVCALVEGVNPTGDIWWYQGGGCELVYETTGTGNQDYMYSFYLEPDQDKWITGSYVTSSNDEKHTNNTKFDAETTYQAIVTDSMDGGRGNAYTNGRTGYTPVRRVSGVSKNHGECCYQYRQIEDDAKGSAGIRSRRHVLFRGSAYHDSCSPRCLDAAVRPSRVGAHIGCAAQVLLA